MNALETILRDLIKESVREVLQEEAEKGTFYAPNRSQIHVDKKRNIDQIKPKDPLSIIRPKAFAKMLDISIPTLYRIDKDGELLPKIRVAKNAVGWRYSDID